MDAAARQMSAAPGRTIRSLGAASRGAIRAHFAALGPEDRLLRFGYQPGEAVLDEYVARIDFGSALLLAACDPQERIAALVELRPRGRDFELGLSVLPRARGQGLGSTLLAWALRHARQRGARRVIIYCQSRNQRMMRLARRFGAQFRCSGSEALGTIDAAGTSGGLPVLARAS